MKILLTLLTHRWSIALANMVIVLMALQGTWNILDHFRNLDAFQGVIEVSIDGLGTIFVAFGVALEERESIMRFLKLYPARLNDVEHAVDHHCHYYGLTLLLVGLFMEVATFLIRMPDLNTVDFDPFLLLGATVLNLVGIFLLARLSWLLLRGRPLEEE